MKYRAVFFDAGETLLAPHPSFQEIFAGVLARKGVEVDVADVTSAFTAIGPSFAQVLEHMGTSAWTTSREVSYEFWSRVYALAFAELGLADLDGSYASALYETFTRSESYRLFPDAVPTLSLMKDTGLVLGLISNFEEWLEGMLIEMEVDPLFDVVVISGKEGIEKPDAGIFNLALERAGVSAQESVYVGDSIRNDVEASAAVGMTPVLIDRRDLHTSFEGARIQTLEELPSLLGMD
ncbi:MAG: HAD-IA family hydrolase [Actinobacteria bacterium]|nr:HAD-IA family hydrolase [Actinomycetota bacterium]